MCVCVCERERERERERKTGEQRDSTIAPEPFSNAARILYNLVMFLEGGKSHYTRTKPKAREHTHKHTHKRCGRIGLWLWIG